MFVTSAVIADGSTITDNREALTNPGHGSVRVATLDISRILNNTAWT